MIKHFFLLSIIFLSGCAQQLYNAQIEMHNSCQIPISVLIDGFTNSGRNTTPLAINLPPNQSARVASSIGFGCCELGVFLPENYQITVFAKDKKEILNREIVIKKSIKNDRKSTRDTHFWTLETKDLCH